MNFQAKTVTVELPNSLYIELAAMASDHKIDLVAMIEDLVHSAQQQQAWQKGWAELRHQVQVQPPQHLVSKTGKTELTEELALHMCKSRQEIFDAEYAHLY